MAYAVLWVLGLFLPTEKEAVVCMFGTLRPWLWWLLATFVFTCFPCNIYHRQVRSLLLCLLWCQWSSVGSLCWSAVDWNSCFVGCGIVLQLLSFILLSMILDCVVKTQPAAWCMCLSIDKTVYCCWFDGLSLYFSKFIFIPYWFHCLLLPALNRWWCSWSFALNWGDAVWGFYFWCCGLFVAICVCVCAGARFIFYFFFYLVDQTMQQGRKTRIVKP